MAAPQASPLRSSDTHLHLASSRCPLCDQTIPNEKLEEITLRIEARDRDLSTALTSRLKEQFSQEAADAAVKAKADLERVANDNTVIIEKLKRDALANASAARAEGKSIAEAALKDELAEAARLKTAAEQAAAESTAILQKVRDDSAAVIGQLKQEIRTKETAARAAGKAEAEATMQTALAVAGEAKATAEQELLKFKVTQQQRLDEQRAALEKAAAESANADRAKAFNEKLKLEGKLQDITRQLQEKTAEELGEGAEVDLFEELKAAFEGDRINRVGKGAAGADIIHDVIHNGKVCGRIVYDSKNRTAWRNDYVSKLLKDQVAAQADHAILSSLAFPSGARQIHNQDNVIITNPARVLVIVELLRRHILQVHSLRLSNESKVEKTAALYKFITSELCNQLLNQIEVNSSDMLDLEVKEKKAHDATWKRRGELIRGVQKARGDLCNQIEIVLGTASESSNVES